MSTSQGHTANSAVLGFSSSLTVCFLHDALSASTEHSGSSYLQEENRILDQDQMASRGFEKLSTQDLYCQIYEYLEFFLETSRGWYLDTQLDSSILPEKRRTDRASHCHCYEPRRNKS